jgi:hypothetical protein
MRRLREGAGEEGGLCEPDGPVTRASNPSIERRTPMTIQRISPVSLMVGLLTTLFIVVGSNVGAAAPPRNAVVGSWVETVTFPPEFGRPPLKSLVTFHEDGTFLNSDQGGVVLDPPNVSSSGQGVWKHLGNRDFAYTQIELLSDLSGNLVGYLKVRGIYTISNSGNEYAGTSFAEVLDTNGNVQFSVTVTNVGKRIQLELPPP